MDSIPGILATAYAIGLYERDMTIHHRVYQFILISIVLIQSFFDMPKLLAISSIDTDRIPYCMNSSSAFTSILSFTSMFVIWGAKLHGNFFVAKVSINNYVRLSKNSAGANDR